MFGLFERRFFGTAVQGALALAVLGALPAAEGARAEPGAAAKPNVVYVLADDLGYGDLGCYGQKMIQTPRLDRLAVEGMRFTQHYSGSPVCAPSRCTLMTGKHTGHASRRANRPYIPLQENDVTVAEVLKSAGYRTAVVGKWGLADTTGDFEPGTTGKPNQRGFDYWFGFLNQKHAWNYYPDFVWENEEQYVLNGAKYIHDLFTEKALEFIGQNHQRPFCIFVEYTTPHVNNAFKHTEDNLPVPSTDPYTDRDWPLVEKKYAAMVTRLDRDMGRIVDLLAELGVAESTMVMFSSDNGAQSYAPHSKEFFQSTGGLREYKGSVYEGGIRVPLVVHWPGVVEPGTVSDHPSAFWDLLPTLAEVVGATPPEGIDGVSFLPALKGEPQPAHEYLYWEFPTRRFQQAIRKGDWKAVRPEAQDPIELYDLNGDPREEHDVADDHPELVAEFARLFAAARTHSEHWPRPRK